MSYIPFHLASHSSNKSLNISRMIITSQTKILISSFSTLKVLYLSYFSPQTSYNYPIFLHKVPPEVSLIIFFFRLGTYNLLGYYDMDVYVVLSHSLKTVILPVKLQFVLSVSVHPQFSFSFHYRFSSMVWYNTNSKT